MIAFQLYSCENTHNDNSYKNSVVQVVYCIIKPVSNLYNSLNFQHLIWFQYRTNMRPYVVFAYFP